MNGLATILRGDARAIPLPDGSVDLIVTSPPYFALRSYQDTCKICLDIRANGLEPSNVLVEYDAHVQRSHHYAGQIGDEPTPQEYVAALIECTREWMRLLKPSGSIFVNLGDKYGPDKSLLNLPERYRIACTDDLGLIQRATMIWSKPNGLPESVKDRVRRSHEDWVHLTKEPHYFAAIDRIREDSTPQRGLAGTFKRPKSSHTLVPGQSAKQQRDDRPDVPAYHPLGRLPGSVWDVATEPLIVPDHIAHARCCGGDPREGCEDGLTHYAAFPTEWPRRLIQGWSPSGICIACGEARQPSVLRERVPDRPGRVQGRAVDALLGGHGPDGRAGSRYSSSVAVTGESCACPNASAPTRPSLVLDPFGGTGTTALVAKVLGRHGISVDMSADYCRLAQWRTTDPAQMAKAARVTPPRKEFDGQGDLLDLVGVVA